MMKSTVPYDFLYAELDKYAGTQNDFDDVILTVDVQIQMEFLPYTFIK